MPSPSPPLAMAAARGVLQSSHERETTKLDEERRQLQRALSTEKDALESVRQQRDELEQKVSAASLPELLSSKVWRCGQVIETREVDGVLSLPLLMW